MGTGASRTVFAPVSRQKARISFELHGCVTWMSMPRTALEPLDSSWQPARFVVLDDRRLQVNRVDHRSFAGYSLHNLGSGQQVAAGARWRGGAPRIRSAIELCCSGGATMCGRERSGESGGVDGGALSRNVVMATGVAVVMGEVIAAAARHLARCESRCGGCARSTRDIRS